MGRRSLSSLVIFICVCRAVGSQGNVESDDEVGANPTGVSLDSSGRVILVGDIPADQLRPLPPNARVITHHAGGSRQAAHSLSGDDSQRLLYSNTLGRRIYAPGTMIRIADDIFTLAADDFELAAYLIRVCGGVEDGDGEFDVIVSLFDQCPSSLPWDAPAIPGTEMKFTGLVDNEEDIHELVIDYSDPNIGICDDARACRISAQDCLDESACVDGPPVIVPSSLWLRVEFSTDEAGWIVGAPATFSYSADRYSHTITGCDTSFGGYPEHPHASFFAKLFGTNVWWTHTIKYLAADPEGPVFDVPGGTSYVRLADDIQLTDFWCELSAIEIATKGTADPYEIDFDLRERLEDGPIPGTQRTSVSRDDGGLGELEIARFTFDPGLNLPRDFWITWQANKPRTGLINAGRTFVGSSRPVYAAYNHPDNPGEWAEYIPADGSPAIFGVAIFCRFQIPWGACCHDQPDEGGQDPVCVDRVSVLGCVDQRWLYGATCPEGHNDPDDPWLLRGYPACGTHACCKPDNTCENLPRDECVAITDERGHPSKWFPGEFCGEYGVACPHFACLHGVIPCSESEDPYVGISCVESMDCVWDFWDPWCDPVTHYCTGARGCNDIECCDWVCSDPYNEFCCDVVWDAGCAAAAADCPGPPGNDECWDPLPGLGAYEVYMEDIGGGAYYGSRETDHTDATFTETDPGFCCHNLGVDRHALATVWYKFRAAMDGTARIHTCGTPEAENAKDSLIQVFTVNDDVGTCDDGTRCSVSAQDCADLSPCLFDEKRACENLTVIGCNDDAPDECGTDAVNGNSDVCVQVNRGDLYYVIVGAGSASQVGRYRVEIEQPCENPQPTNSFCVTAVPLPSPPAAPNGPFSVPFDLTNASIDCPGEPCMPTMKNDIWFDHKANCTGRMRVETCGQDPDNPDPDTTLAVYRGEVCPPDSLIGCNDDAEVDAANHELREQWCEFGLNSCDTRDDCGMICEISHDPCTSDSDCDVGNCADGSSCSVSAQNCFDDSTCVQIERCVSDVCISDCGSASSVIVPVIQSEWYKIRLGGFMGGTPSGELTIECIPEDCNFNGLPDSLDIAEGRSEDCNRNDVPDECDIFSGDSADCQLNKVPDECEIWMGIPGCNSWCVCGCVPDCNLNCIPDICEVTGACCREGAACEVLNPEACTNLGGEYLGDDTSCDPDPCMGADANLISSVPRDDYSLWRSQNNIARFTFDADITKPMPGQVEIRELLPRGACGPDLSASFTFEVESDLNGNPRILKVQEDGSVLQHRRWYAVLNPGSWKGVAEFEIHYVVQVGDCDGNTLVISLEVGCVNASIPCFANCGDDNRADIDGDGRVISLDVGVVNAHIGSFALGKPTGHDGNGCPPNPPD